MYPDVSIKNPERERRGAGGSIQIAINHGNQKYPTQWKKYLSDGSNKACTDACGCRECNSTQDIGRTENDSSDEDEELTILVDTPCHIS